jgi:hypothetical protein
MASDYLNVYERVILQAKGQKIDGLKSDKDAVRVS